MDGSLTDGKNKLDIETGSTSILFSNPTYTLENKLALKLKANSCYPTTSIQSH